MAGTSLLMLIDDISTILDDVSTMTHMAAKKTAGVLGDDLALNAQQVSGVNADRELPVVWAVAKGSFINKLILVPSALVISAFAAWLISPLLMLGGLFLCYEGVEKLFHSFFHKNKANQQLAQTTVNTHHNTPSTESEQDKIKGAIRTDFVLSAEIIVITLGTVATATFTQQVIVLSSIAIIMTIGVYGLVAGIVKLDDGGLYLASDSGKSMFSTLKRKLGLGILSFAPYMMKSLSILGTAAMFLVGGAILTHGFSDLHHWIEHIATTTNHGILQTTIPALLNGLFGIVAGATALTLINIIVRFLPNKKTSK